MVAAHARLNMKNIWNERRNLRLLERSIALWRHRMMKEVANIVEEVGAPELCETTVADDGRIAHEKTSPSITFGGQ